MDKKSYLLRNYHGLELKLPAFAFKTKQGMKNNPTTFIPANIPVGDAAFATLIKNDEEAYANWRAGVSQNYFFLLQQDNCFWQH